MTIPNVASVGALTVGVSGISPAMPPSPILNDILLIHMINLPADGGPLISVSAGGTWNQCDPFYSPANATSRSAFWWSRYNGTQTAPTLSAGTDKQIARMVAIRGCITTGSPLNNLSNMAPTFAETVSVWTGFTVTSPECLICAFVSGDGPDADGTGIFTGYTHAELINMTEHYDDSSAQGSGGSIALLSGGKVATGALADLTGITHASMRVSGKLIAFTPAVLTPTDIFRAGRVPIRIVADAAGVVPIRYTTAAAGVVPVVTTTATDAGVVPAVVKADAAGVVPVVETA